MSDQAHNRPTILLWFFRLFTLLNTVPFLINTVDILLHPIAEIMENLDPIMRPLMGLLVAPLTLVMAILCIRRAPGNLIGWQMVAFSYGISVQVMRLDLFPLQWELMVGNMMIGLFWFAFLLIPLYFPDGQLYPPRTNRWGNPLIAFLIIFTLVLSSISNPRLELQSKNLSVPNPTLIYAWDYTMVTRWIIPLLLAAGLVTVILRYRGSRGIERLQMRWLFFGVSVQALIALSGFFIPVLEVIEEWFAILINLIIPFSVGIAILRYRLYDIDLIIRRTLQYGLLSAVLGLVYYGLVVVLGQLFQGITGQQSPLVIVISTLAIAALFNPLRRRIQQAIDRRFFRQQYDGEQTLQAFSSAARHETDLRQLSGSLVSAVQQSIQPENVSLWLPAAGSRPARMEKK